MVKKSTATEKSNDVNVSETIREYVRTHRTQGPKAAAAEISKKIGKDIPASYVSNIKTLMRKKKRKTRAAPVLAKRAKRDPRAVLFSIEQLENVRSLVGDLGREGVEKLMD